MAEDAGATTASRTGSSDVKDTPVENTTASAKDGSTAVDGKGGDASGGEFFYFYFLPLFLFSSYIFFLLVSLGIAWFHAFFF